MAERRQRQRQEAGPGWLAALGGAALLVVLGFAVGLVAGAAWEEPDLVMDHLAGRSTEIPLHAEISADPVEPAQPSSIARPMGIGEGSLAADRSRSVAEPPRVAAPPPARAPASQHQRGFAVQVGAFGDQASAGRLVRELREGGFAVYVSSDDGPKAARFRVRVGPVPTREEATRLARKLKSDHQLPTWILSYESR